MCVCDLCTVATLSPTPTPLRPHPVFVPSYHPIPPFTPAGIPRVRQRRALHSYTDRPQPPCSLRSSSQHPTAAHVFLCSRRMTFTAPDGLNRSASARGAKGVPTCACAAAGASLAAPNGLNGSASARRRSVTGAPACACVATGACTSAGAWASACAGPAQGLRERCRRRGPGGQPSPHLRRARHARHARRARRARFGLRSLLRRRLGRMGPRGGCRVGAACMTAAPMATSAPRASDWAGGRGVGMRTRKSCDAADPTR